MSSSCSGKFVLRVPARLHAALRSFAASSGQSLNSACVQLIERGLLIPKNSPEALGNIVASLVENFHEDLLGVVLFGSFARGEQHDNSDLDLLVVLSSKVPIRRSLYDVQTFDKVSLHFVQLPSAAETAGSLWLEASIDGRILYELGSEITDTLRAIRAFVASGKIVRRETHGQGYWVRQ